MAEQTVLVVDDEPQILRVLRHALEEHGLRVRTASDAESALDLLSALKPDLLITDLGLPGMAGIELCRRVRALSSLPIIVLSVKGEEAAKVEALDCGADDYVTKPFGVEELLARIRALLRRAPDAFSGAPSFAAGDFEVNTSARRIRLSGRELQFTPKEYDLMLLFLRNPDRVLTHRFILNSIWGPHSTEQPEYLRVFVGQLRKKVEKDPSHPRYLVTDPWVGYRFSPVEDGQTS
jgi:two-component system, OmpR family, KDP operon response regulator KdpE